MALDLLAPSAQEDPQALKDVVVLLDLQVSPVPLEHLVSVVYLVEQERRVPLDSQVRVVFLDELVAWAQLAQVEEQEVLEALDEMAALDQLVDLDQMAALVALDLREKEVIREHLVGVDNLDSQAPMEPQEQRAFPDSLEERDLLDPLDFVAL